MKLDEDFSRSQLALHEVLRSGKGVKDVTRFLQSLDRLDQETLYQHVDPVALRRFAVTARESVERSRPTEILSEIGQNLAKFASNDPGILLANMGFYGNSVPLSCEFDEVLDSLYRKLGIEPDSN